jgi:hypothetical protein
MSSLDPNGRPAPAPIDGNVSESRAAKEHCDV